MQDFNTNDSNICQATNQSEAIRVCQAEIEEMIPVVL